MEPMSRDTALERHPLNQHFEWTPTARPLKRLSEEQAHAYDEQGFFVMKDAIDPDTLGSIRAETDAFEERTTDFLRTRPEGKFAISQADAITFSPHLSARSPRLAAFCASAVFQDVCHDLIGPDVRLYWDQAVYKKPEPAREFPWHQDNGYTYIEPQRYLTCWVALNDATIENGCPWVVPGLHRYGTLAHWPTELGYQCLKDAPDAVPAPVPAGGMVVFSSLTPHRTGPNRTDGVRKAYIVQFAPDGAVRLEPQGDSYRRVPCDVPERQFPILVAGQGCSPPAPG